MTTNKHLFDVADEMAAALKKITDGLAKDGVALEGFTEAIAIQNKWAQIKLKRTMECFAHNVKICATGLREKNIGAGR